MYFNSFETYMEAYEIYNQKNDKENLLRILGQASDIMVFLMQYLEDPDEIKPIFCRFLVIIIHLKDIYQLSLAASIAIAAEGAHNARSPAHISSNHFSPRFRSFSFFNSPQ